MVKNLILVVFLVAASNPNNNLHAAKTRAIGVSPIRTENFIVESRLASLERSYTKLFKLFECVGEPRVLKSPADELLELEILTQLRYHIVLFQAQKCDSELILNFLNSEDTQALVHAAKQLIDVIEQSRTKRSIEAYRG